MATTRDLKRRIKSIKNISQITKAVQMVAVSKMRRAQQQALRGQPYSQKMEEMLKVLAGRTDAKFHPLLQKGAGEKICILLISPNKGLCGGLLNSLSRKVYDFAKLYEEKQVPLEFILIGKKGENLLLKLRQKVIAEFSDLPDQPLFTETIPISQMIIKGFTQGEFKKIVVIFTHFISTLNQKTEVKEILPIRPPEQVEKIPYYILYEPAPTPILERLLPFYVELLIYHLILEGIASEHSARMVAMKNATDNASEMLEELSLIYNQARQAAITKEVSEIATARISMEKR